MDRTDGEDDDDDAKELNLQRQAVRQIGELIQFLPTFLQKSTRKFQLGLPNR